MEVIAVRSFASIPLLVLARRVPWTTVIDVAKPCVTIVLIIMTVTYENYRCSNSATLTVITLVYLVLSSYLYYLVY